MITNQPDVSFDWDERWTSLSLRLQHGQPGEKTFYIIINDADHLFQINCYQIVLCSYAKLSEHLILGTGEVQKIKLDFSLDEKTLTQKYESIFK
jgi:hypothetical protein